MKPRSKMTDEEYAELKASEAAEAARLRSSPRRLFFFRQVSRLKQWRYRMSRRWHLFWTGGRIGRMGRGFRERPDAPHERFLTKFQRAFGLLREDHE